MIDALDFLYIVLAVGLIPFFTLLCMVLWRVYRLMDRADHLIGIAESILHVLQNWNRIPSMLAEKILARIDRWIK